ncbi:formate dehydrogenase subunit gamma [Aquabacterium sp.]|uniref:formate dehydrogenase subunit gamma n=1 Tax=Aquabacterium sp. TaxID=1872578 RepID=UPI002CCA337C|nr:formate dehydrogenase subunit gamma [Aquabacterium sp.]HSW03648.1 formate dehydrogenase subunit gamma [Aquabacterium sp.]
MQILIRTLVLASALLLCHGSVMAQAAAQPPAATSSAPEPKPDDTNAQRAKSQPGNNAPFWRAVRESGNQAGTSNLPGAEKGVLIQPFVQYPGVRWNNAGEAWRQVRNKWILPYGGALVIITLLAIAIFYWRKGPLGSEHAPTGRVIERFTPFERAAHWSNAIAFSILAISGLVMAFGKFFLLPVIGGTLFGGLSYVLKTAHNFAGPLFAVSVLIVFLTFLRDNWPSAADLRWLLQGGGMIGRAHPPSARFNGGEKLIFWGGVLLLGSVVVGSGLVLDKVLPGLDYLRTDMQVAHMIHAVAALLMVVVFLGHIYMGTIGTRGAFQAMRTGYVDEAWAREHHALWLADIEAGKIPAQRSADKPPAPLSGQPHPT